MGMTTQQPTTVFSIGHSAHTFDVFLALLRGAGITAIADVRSSPHSRYLPQFGRDTLEKSLREAGIAYVFLGKELGGRPEGRGMYRNGVADYERMAAAPVFAHGIGRLIEGAGRHRICMLCSEKDPLDCHRCLLVGRRLWQRGIAVRHILGDGAQATHEAIEASLLEMTGRAASDLFATREERLELAYREWGAKVAFSETVERAGAVDVGGAP